VSIVINQIVERTHEAKRLAHAKLEVKESGRELASLQGQIAGRKEYLGILAAEFHLSQSFLEDTGDSSLILVEMEEADLEGIQAEINELQHCEEWGNVLARIDGLTSDLKDYLLFGAEKSRDLDICQGKHKAHVAHVAFFEAVKIALEWVRKKAAEKKEELPFGKKSA